MRFFTVMFYNIVDFNNHILVKYIGRFCLIVLLLHNYKLYILNSDLLFKIILYFSIINLFTIVLIQLISSKILHKWLHKDTKSGVLVLNKYFYLDILNIIVIILILYKLYLRNIEYLSIDLLILYLILYSFISMITNSNFIKNKLVLFKTINLISIGRLSSSGISTVGDTENKDKSSDFLIHLDSKPTNVVTNNSKLNVNINAEDAVKKAMEILKEDMRRIMLQSASQLGLAASITGGMSAGAAISSGQNIKVRAGTTLAMGAAGGLIQVGLSSLNRGLIKSEEMKVNKDSKFDNNSPPSPDGFINCPNEEIYDNPVELLLYCIWGLHIVLIVLLIMLLFTMLSKILLSLNYKLNWLDKIFSKEKSIQIRSVLLRIFNILSNIRNFNILMLIISLIVISLVNFYLYSAFLFNLNDFCELHLKIISEWKK